jgi:hydrogenase maturation factor
MGTKAKRAIDGMGGLNKAVTREKSIDGLDKSGKAVIRSDGFGLFMRFADGCRCYLQARGILSEEDNRAILGYFRTGRRPRKEVLRRVYYVAFPGLETKGKRTGKGMFSPDVVREFYAFDHNRMKVEQGNYVCIAFPARVLQKQGSEYLLDLSPVRGRFWIDSDLELEAGNWVIVHRMNVVERVSEGYAGRVSGHLKKLGMNKEMGFPERAIEYLKGLKRHG